MEETENYYYKLPYKTTILDHICDLINDGGAWANYHSFDMKQLSHKKLILDPFLSALFKRHECVALIIKMKPNTCYHWHVDEVRQSGINLLVSTGKSECLFAVGAVTQHISNIVLLPYESEYYYIFNTQVPHEIINYDQQRFILSIQFTQQNISYEDLLKDLKNNPLEQGEI